MPEKSDSEDSDFCWDSDEDETKPIPIASCSNAGNNNGEETKTDLEGSDFCWTSEDEQETKPFPISHCPYSRTNDAEASSSAGPSCSKEVSHFVGMGFSKEMVVKAIEENGEGNAEAILETLLTYSALDGSPLANKCVNSDLSSESAGAILDEFSDMDSDFGYKEKNHLSAKKLTLKRLVDMGYPADEASIAIDRCGPGASDIELTDFICAAQMARETDAYLAAAAEVPSPSSDEYERKPSHFRYGPPPDKKRRFSEEDERWKRKKESTFEKKFIDEDDDTIRLPNPMVGFGLPGDTKPNFRRTIPEAAMGPPFFYYENVALAPKGVWSTISRFLYEIEPEFVDSMYFSAAARKRGYIHNLPIHNRTPLLPKPPQTIQEAFPLTKQWWPSWDHRTKLNCIQTCSASAKLTDRIKKALDAYDEPPIRVQKDVIDECRRWNLVWVGKNKTAPLEPDEIETLLGFPKNHTRGGGVSKTERLKGLGNSFQVDTVAFHLSVLKDMFPGGMNVLSLFSGIGGGEVALHRLGIPLKTVVSVEISQTSRNVLRSWWESTNQKGTLIDITDVQLLDAEKLEQLINSLGGFDLIIGGSPCNNISGANRVSRDGLEGKHSALFYDFFRILNQVKVIMGKT